MIKNLIINKELGKKAVVLGVLMLFTIGALSPLTFIGITISADDTPSKFGSTQDNIELCDSSNSLDWDPRAIVWDAQLDIAEPSGKNDNVVFGEAPDANDGGSPDSYDAPKPPAPFPPYIYAWFDDNLPTPYDKLDEDYRKYPDVYKVWNLTVKWENGSFAYIPDITISWNTTDVDDSEYNSVELWNATAKVADMLTESSYTYTQGWMYIPPNIYLWIPASFQIICIVAANQPPVAVNDTASTPEDTAVDINVTANDYDTDGFIDVTTVTIVSVPSHGGTSVNPTTGIVTYTPDSNYHGPDSFTYEVDDDDGATSNVATVSVTVTDVNDPPVAVNDAASTPEDTPVVIDVTANDYDIDGTIDVTTVTIVSGPSHGGTSVNPTTGIVTYTPDSNYHGPDSFTYNVKDDDGATSNTATVSITVTDVNDPPVAVNDVATTPKNTPVVIDILANDYDIDGTIDPTTVTIVTDASHGSTSVNPTNGQVTYTPDLNYFGPDYFTYTVEDDDGATSNVATVSITVIGDNIPPVAVDDFATTPEDTPVVIDILANDYDPDGTIDPTTVVIVNDVSHGSTSVNPTNGMVTYTPDPDYHGSDSFTYNVKDNDGATSNDATVFITVTDVNDPPIAVDDFATTPENTPVVIDVLANDYDPDGTIYPSTVTIVTDASHGSTSVNPTNGQVTYIPDLNYNGPDSFTYTVKDDDGATSNIATVDIAVGNDPPNKPDRPSGPTRGKAGVVYTYETSTTDPNNDQIWYNFSWGDGTYSGWVGPYNSGDKGSASHAWERGTYEIKVIAKDEEGLESEESDPLPIAMPLLQGKVAASNVAVQSLSSTQQSQANHNPENTQCINPFSHNYRDGSYIRQFINFILGILRGEYSGMNLVDILRTEGWIK